MEDVDYNEALKEKLIIAGLQEIEAFGLASFSLRRVAAGCGASCAAPYKHFKNKDDFILEIVRYFNRKWELMETQITELFGDNTEKCLVELVVANIRFRIANPNFSMTLTNGSPALSSPDFNRERLKLNESIRFYTEKYCREKNLTAAKTSKLTLRTLSTVLGASLMLTSGELENTPATFNLIKETILK